MSEKVYDTAAMVCRSLTNYHITRQALQEEDNACFQQQRRRVNTKGLKWAMKKFADARSYRRSQRQGRFEDIASQGDTGSGTLKVDKIQNPIDSDSDGEGGEIGIDAVGDL